MPQELRGIMYVRPEIDGFGLALSCDKTTTGARLISSIPLDQVNIFGFCVIRKGDKTSACPACGIPGTIVEGAKEYPRVFMGLQAAVDGCQVSCGCPPGSNRIRAPLGWMRNEPSPAPIDQEKYLAALAAQKAERDAKEKRQTEERDRNRVFAKSCLRGNGCNDAGDQQEPHTHFADMCFFRAMPVQAPAIDAGAPQHAQATKKSKPTPKKRSALYTWWNGDHEETDYQAAVATAAAATRAQTATAGASVLEQLKGQTLTRGTWAVRVATSLGQVAATGAGSSIAGLRLA